MKNILFALISSAILLFIFSGNALSSDKISRDIVVVNNTPTYALLFFEKPNWRDPLQFRALYKKHNSWRQLPNTNIIFPKKKGTINFNDGTGTCYFDAKAVLTDGTLFITVKKTINVCEEEKWIIEFKEN